MDNQETINEKQVEKIVLMLFNIRNKETQIK